MTKNGQVLIPTSDLASYLRKVVDLTSSVDEANYQISKLAEELDRRLENLKEEIYELNSREKTIVNEINLTISEKMEEIIENKFDEKFMAAINRRMQAYLDNHLDTFDAHRDKIASILTRLSRMDDLLCHRIAQLEVEVSRGGKEP